MRQRKEFIMKKLIIYLFLAGMVSFAFNQKTYADPENWLDVLNYFRGMAKLPEVKENINLRPHCEEAAEYLAENFPKPSNPHKLDGLVSDEAADAAAFSVICRGPKGYVGTDVDCVINWITEIYHSTPLTYPELHTVGFGSDTKGKNKAGVLNTAGIGSSLPEEMYPFYFPGNNSYTPLRTFGDDESYPKSPFQDCPGYNSVQSGSPIFLWLSFGFADHEVGAYSLTEKDYEGHVVNLEACKIVDERAIALIPKKHLNIRREYKATIYVKGVPYTWSFTTWPTKLWGDILWYHPLGLVGVWYMEGHNLTGGSWIGFIPEPESINWRVVETVDLNNDGSTDILARNISTGENAVAFYDGPTLKEVKPLETWDNLDYEIVGTGDFNVDGRKDILWHNTKTGHNRIWLMDGIKTIDRIWISHTNTDWKIVGTGHFRGNASTDILWQNTKTGRIALWYMKNTKFKGEIAEIGYVAPNWEVAATTDMNDDGRPDILWRNSANGWNAVWYMDDNVTTSVEWLPPVNIPGMQIVGTGNFK
jgi:hypothetical protein